MTILAIDLTANRTKLPTCVPLPENGTAEEKAREILANANIRHWIDRVYDDHARDPYYL